MEWINKQSLELDGLNPGDGDLGRIVGALVQALLYDPSLLLSPT